MDNNEKWLRACQDGDLDIVLDGISKQMDVLRVRTPHGNTGLHLACGARQVQVVKALMESTVANDLSLINAVNSNGDTALMMACVAADHEIILMLLRVLQALPVQKNSSQLGPLELCCIADPPKSVVCLAICLAFSKVVVVVVVVFSSSSSRVPHCLLL